MALGNKFLSPTCPPGLGDVDTYFFFRKKYFDLRSECVRSRNESCQRHRADLSGYPTIRETNIPPTVEYVTQLESVNGEQAGLSHVLMESGGRLAIRAQVGMGKTTALELTLREMMQSGEVEFVLFIGYRITQIPDL